MRADAAKNRAKLLAVAERLFHTRGVSVEMDEIAAEAGVAVGTIYRHFPTKAALVEAVIVTPIEALIAEAHQRASAPDPGAAFFELFEKLVGLARAKHHLVASFVETGKAAPMGVTREIVSRRVRFRAAFGKLLAHAQRAGAVRRDIRVPEIIAIVNGAFPYLERDGGSPAAHGRLLKWIEGSLRAES
jgi:AcrR family transcriptional regulator